MQISNDELREIIRQELIDEGVKDKAAAAAVTVGTELVVSMLSSQDGRDKLAGLLVYLPDFFKRVLCDSGLPKLLEKVSPGKVSFIIPYLSKLCSFSFSMIGAPLYVVAALIRTIGDEEAKVLSNQVKKTAGGTAQPGPEEDPSDEADDIIDAEWEEVSPEPAHAGTAPAGL